MITLHHLNQSRSIRILWLLEEIGVPYELKRYQRNPDTQLAPPELKNVHPLGKAPVLEAEGITIAESGAMVEWLINRHAPHLAPAQDSTAYAEYLQWIHFAESSAMFPMLLGLFASKESQQLDFLPQYAARENTNILAYLDAALASKTYLLGDQLTGADFMMSFAVAALGNRGHLEHYPNIKRYGEQLASLPSWQRAQEIVHA